jgi:hypothetical protein
VTFKGSVNPNEQATTCEFQYGPTETYGETVACSPEPGSGKSPVTVTGAVTGLTKGTTYHYRLVVKYTNSEDKPAEVVSAGKTLKTLEPTAITGAAQVTTTTATLNAKVDDQGNAASACTFEYGPTEAYGTSVACSSTPGAVKEEVSVSAQISGLSPASKYHFRIALTIGGSTTYFGSDVAFETASEHVETTPTETTPTTTKTEPPPPPPPPTYAKAKVTVLSASTVSSSGAFTIKLSCGAGAGVCSGTITLKTAKAVIARLGHEAKAKASILALASGSFTITAGQTKTITLHLSSKAKALLAKSHSIAAKATTVARNSAGASTTQAFGFTLKPAKKKK